MSTGNRYTLAEYAQVAGLKGVQLEVVHTIEDTEPLFASAPIIKCNSGQVNNSGHHAVPGWPDPRLQHGRDR